MANILVVGPHPDDQEFGMGATIALLASQGHDILLLDMTNGEPTPLGDPATRAKEAASALVALNGAPSASSGRAPRVRRLCLGLPNRMLEHSLGARHAVAKVIREHKANIVFTPFFEDAHPDHIATTRIVEDARFDAKLTRMSEPGRWRAGDLVGETDPAPDRAGVATPTKEWFHAPPDDAKHPPLYPKWLFYYYATHLRWVANPSFCIDVAGHMPAKLAAIRAYETQFVRANAHVVEWVEAAALYFGSRIGSKAAEPFYSKEPLGLRGLESLA